MPRKIDAHLKLEKPFWQNKLTSIVMLCISGTFSWFGTTHFCLKKINAPITLYTFQNTYSNLLGTKFLTSLGIFFYVAPWKISVLRTQHQQLIKFISIVSLKLSLAPKTSNSSSQNSQFMQTKLKIEWSRVRENRAKLSCSRWLAADSPELFDSRVFSKLPWNHFGGVNKLQSYASHHRTRNDLVGFACCALPTLSCLVIFRVFRLYVDMRCKIVFIKWPVTKAYSNRRRCWI